MTRDSFQKYLTEHTDKNHHSQVATQHFGHGTIPDRTTKLLRQEFSAILCQRFKVRSICALSIIDYAASKVNPNSLKPPNVKSEFPARLLQIQHQTLLCLSNSESLGIWTTHCLPHYTYDEGHLPNRIQLRMIEACTYYRQNSKALLDCEKVHCRIIGYP